MQTKELTQGTDGRSYQVVNGTWYHKDTDPEVIKILNQLLQSRKTVIIKNGDVETGRDWMEENDTKGVIGRSTGTIKIPLLIPKGEHGGPGLLEHCIVKIVQGDKVLYQHPKYNRPVITLGESDMPEYIAAGFRDGELVARFSTGREAGKWIEAMLA